MYKYILFSIENNIATLTLNRPEFGNAFHEESYVEIKHAMEECANNDLVRAVVIKGEGKFFSAGGDVVGFKELIETKKYFDIDLMKNVGGMTRSVRECPKPVVAMIRGAAAGAGMSLAMSCDFRIMTENAKLITAFIGMGFPADSGLLYFLCRAVGTAKATDMVMLSKPVSAQEALNLGLCNKVVEEDKLEEETMKFAKYLASQPTQALMRQKKLITEFFNKDLEDFNNREAEYMCEASRTEDHAEAVYAFLEKRAPQFKGK
jgi:2-(1,2-epoxy-1,2-dihydrophenyl)acetyl-CoA isomerase